MKRTRFPTSRANPISCVTTTMVIPSVASSFHNIQNFSYHFWVKRRCRLIKEHHFRFHRKVLLRSQHAVSVHRELDRICICTIRKPDVQSSSAFSLPLLWKRLWAFIGARVILSRMVICGNRLKCWKTIPIFWRSPSISSFTVLPEASLYFFLVMSTPLKLSHRLSALPEDSDCEEMWIYRNRMVRWLPLRRPLLISAVTPSSALIAPLW